MTPTDTTPLRILYVEDDGLTAHNTLAALAKVAETDVRHCRRWSEAEALVDVVDFDVAVLDVRLRGEEVFPIADLLAEMGVPIVFHSGHAQSEELSEAYPGAAVLSKPAPIDRLVNALAERLRPRRA